MAVTVRRANKNDARVIAGLAIELFAQHHVYDSLRFAEIASTEGAANFYGNQSETAGAAVIVAEIENKIVGFAYLQFEAVNYADLLENAVWLHDLFIKESARRQKVGTLLIEKSAEIAKELGANKLMLSVAAKNEYGRDFFGQKGFRETMVEMMLDLTAKEGND